VKTHWDGVHQKISEEDEIGSVCGTHGEKGTVLRVLLGKTEYKRPSGRP